MFDKATTQHAVQALRKAVVRHGELRGLSGEAERPEPDRDQGPGDMIASFVARATAMADRYKAPGLLIGTKLANAAPCMFTFLIHPEMHSINNGFERAISYRSYGARYAQACAPRKA